MTEPDNQDQERQAFEAWIRNLHGKDYLNLERYEEGDKYGCPLPGQYVSHETRLAWEAWLEGMKRQAAMPLNLPDQAG